MLALAFAALTFSQKDSSVTGVRFCPTVMKASLNKAYFSPGAGTGKKNKIGTKTKGSLPEGRERTRCGSGANT